MSAQAYKEAGYSFEAPCQDILDCACRSHDRDCAHPLGCSAAADRKLAAAASLNAILVPEQRGVSLAVAGLMAAISTRRRR